MTAAECTAGSPTILPYRAIYRYGTKPTRSRGERSARLCHVGREAAWGERAGQRGSIYARVRERTMAAEMESFAAMNQAPLHGCPERFWYRPLPHRNSEGSSPVTMSAVSRRTCLPSSFAILENRFSSLSKTSFFSYYKLFLRISASLITLNV